MIESQPDFEDDWLPVAWVALLLAVGAALLTVGSPMPRVSEPANALGLGLFLITFPGFVRSIILRRHPYDSWLFSLSFLTLLGLILAGITGWLLLFFCSESPPFLVAGCGYSLTACRLLQSRSGFNLRSIRNGIPGAAFLTSTAIVIGGLLFGIHHYHDPLFEEMLVHGIANVDELLHASIAGMFLTNGVLSTGLDGTPPVVYHAGSHFYFALLSHSLQQTPLEFYHISFPIVFQPLGLYAILTLTRALRGASNGERLSQWRWVALYYGCIGICPLLGIPSINEIAPGFPCRYSWCRVYTGESNALGVILLTLGIAALLTFIRSSGVATTGSKLFAVMFFSLLLGCIGWIKVAIPPVILPVAAYGLLRYRQSRNRFNVSMFALASCCAIIAIGLSLPLKTVNAATPALDSDRILIADLLRHHLKYIAELIAPYEFVLMLVVLRIRAEACRTWGDLCAAVRSGRLLDAELIVLMALVGVIPGVLGIGGQNAHYFANYQFPIALAMVIHQVSQQKKSSSTQVSTDFAATPLSNILKIGLATALFICGGIISACDLLPELFRDNLASRGWQLASRGLESRNSDSETGGQDQPPVGWAAYRVTSFDRFREINQQLNADTLRQLKNPEGIFHALDKCSRLPLDVKRKSLIFIPYRTTSYWKLVRHCPTSNLKIVKQLAGMMIAPAFTGIAQLGGFPEEGLYADSASSGLGFSEYSESVMHGPRGMSENDPAGLLEEARKRGFSQVIVIDQDSDGKVSVYRLNNDGVTEGIHSDADGTLAIPLRSF
ncbi:MAG: hypothetical protein ACK526_06695 [Planctomyces sp.]